MITGTCTGRSFGADGGREGNRTAAAYVSWAIRAKASILLEDEAVRFGVELCSRELMSL